MLSTLNRRYAGKATLQSIIRGALDDAAATQLERRSQGRRPYFQPVVLTVGDSQERFAAFSRDVSPEGIGLLHWMPIKPQRIMVTLTLSSGQVATVTVDIKWCVSCGEGWYVSGGGFVDGRYE